VEVGKQGIVRCEPHCAMHHRLHGLLVVAEVDAWLRIMLYQTVRLQLACSITAPTLQTLAV
jgi:hypothetical protein